MKQIPNILSVLRLLMIPAFVFTYFEMGDGKCVFIPAGIYTLAWLTDVLDGYLARRNNWITDVGKILDPLADKAMQLAAILCFTFDNTVYLVILIPFLVKEFGMLFGSMFIMTKKNVVVQSSWYGKFSTTVLFVCAFTRILVRGNALLDIILSLLMFGMVAFSLLMYYFKEFKGKYNLKLFRN